MWSITERFPTWGENGEFPVDGFFYEGGDQVNQKHLDALWNGLKEFENETRAALEDIDSDSDGEVDAADIARTLDSSEVGDGLNGGSGTTLSVDVTDLLTTGITEDGSNNLKLDESVIKDGGPKEIDVQEFSGGQGTDGQILTTDGSDATWSKALSGVEKYDTKSNIEAVDEGNVAYVRDTNTLYVEDGH